MKYRVVVSETQTYEVYIEANSIEMAEEMALETYGSDGEIFQINVEVVDIDDSEEF